MEVLESQLFIQPCAYQLLCKAFHILAQPAGQAAKAVLPEDVANAGVGPLPNSADH